MDGGMMMASKKTTRCIQTEEALIINIHQIKTFKTELSVIDYKLLIVILTFFNFEKLKVQVLIFSFTFYHLQ